VDLPGELCVTPARRADPADQERGRNIIAQPCQQGLQVCRGRIGVQQADIEIVGAAPVCQPGRKGCVILAQVRQQLEIGLVECGDHDRHCRLVVIFRRAADNADADRADPGRDTGRLFETLDQRLGHLDQWIAQVQKAEIGLGRNVDQLLEAIIEKLVAGLTGAMREQESIHHGR